ncbi:phosphopantetheine-binding protein, partial [uncultured Tenacibaculum sp.]
QSVVIVKGSGNDQYLVCYYTSASSLVASELEEYLQGVLPEYMVPGAYVILDSFPLTSNGKIDYRSLPEASMVSKENYVSPETALEAELVAIWSEVLSIESSELSVTQSFFRLGGHSLKAISLVNKLNKELGLVLNLRDIFTYQDIRSLAR